MVPTHVHVLFEYTRDHSSEAVDDVLAGYQGYVVAGAHVVYDHLYASGDLVEVNCWAHCRRYFFKALDSDPERAKVALGFIGPLFRIERTLADSPRIFSWCDAYSLRAQSARRTLALHRRRALPIYNNLSELALRRPMPASSVARARDVRPLAPLLGRDLLTR